ncbi:tetratricopeptide repeat protein [Plastorhodobacter daqingensis]|uniref:Tetratricopeptide repeat protein n=1 Tax=Plastorhodobacter daqingensis TaxID=1387281 RepID=A0ABW2UF68_9RHOB
MGCHARFLNRTVAALVAILLWTGGPAPAQADRVEELYEQLQREDQPGWQRIERALIAEWSKSGSAAADLLLQRGRAALSRNDPLEAIEHLTALTDHAPDFAEGWNARAEAFFRQGLYGAALADIARALELNPRHFIALSGLGTILEDLGQYEPALAAYRQARAIHPHQPDVKAAIADLERRVAGQRV